MRFSLAMHATCYPGDPHRFRLQIFPAGRAELFYDFDISGVRDAFKAVACVEHQP